MAGGLTRVGFFRHDTDPGSFLPLPPGEGGGEGSCAMTPSSPHPYPLPEGEGTRNLPQKAGGGVTSKAEPVPNRGLHLTASSVRSCAAPTFGSG